MRIPKNADPYKIVLFAPLIFVLHVAEESPGFVKWFNSLVSEGITPGTFWSVNGFALVITVALTAFAAGSKERVAAMIALAWLSFLMFANGLFHLVATVVHGRYSPGTVTSALLYLPYFVWFVWLMGKELKIKLPGLVVTIIAGSLPMCVHGYLIVFEGSRLF
jgi:hypothetical protein